MAWISLVNRGLSLLSQRADDAVSGNRTPTFVQPLPFVAAAVLPPPLPLLPVLGAALLPQAASSIVIRRIPQAIYNGLLELNNFIDEPVLPLFGVLNFACENHTFVFAHSTVSLLRITILS